jgi:hypothetical protein
MSVEPLPPCGELDPEDHAGEPVDDGFDDLRPDMEPPDGPMPPKSRRTATARVRREVTDDGSVDSGAVPGQPPV